MKESATSSRADRLRITEIFHSLQGESRSVGLRTVFIRLTGCPLRCRWCDTSYAFQGGDWMNLDQILEEVASHDVSWVTVTGGEPLSQASCGQLLSRLCDLGYQTSLETSGALDISGLDPRVSIVMDLKAPGSGEVDRNRYQNLSVLTEKDQLKFVLADRQDYDWALSVLSEHGKPAGCELLFSPVHGQLSATSLADWILSDRLDARLQLQLHKLLWGDEAGR